MSRMLGMPTLKKIIGFGWVIQISNKFLQGFQKCNIYSARTMPSAHHALKNEQALPGLPAQFCWAGLLGRACLSRGFVRSKIKKDTFVRVEKLSFWESPVKIHDVIGTPSIHESTEHLSEVLQMFLLTTILTPHNIYYLSLFTHCFVLFGLMQ